MCYSINRVALSKYLSKDVSVSDFSSMSDFCSSFVSSVNIPSMSVEEGFDPSVSISDLFSARELCSCDFSVPTDIFSRPVHYGKDISFAAAKGLRSVRVFRAGVVPPLREKKFWAVDSVVTVPSTRDGSGPTSLCLTSSEDQKVIVFPHVPAQIANPWNNQSPGSVYMPIEVKHSTENKLIRVIGTVDSGCQVISSSVALANVLGLTYKPNGDSIQTADGNLQPRLVAEQPIYIYHSDKAISYFLTVIPGQVDNLLVGSDALHKLGVVIAGIGTDYPSALLNRKPTPEEEYMKEGWKPKDRLVDLEMSKSEAEELEMQRKKN